MLKINFGNAADNNFLTIKTINNKLTGSGTDDSGIKNIYLSGFDEKDYVRSAFYSFIKGDIQKSLNDFNTFYNSISVGDDFSYMRLGLKLSSLGFFNLASKSFDNVKDKDIWGLQIDSNKNIVHEGASPERINHLLNELVKWYNKHKNKYPALVLAAVVHNQFENIHPFRDGNGRVGRILLNNILIKHNLPPINIDFKKRLEYYATLQSYQKEHNLNYTIFRFFNT